MLNGIFQEHIPYDLVWAYLWLPLGLLALYGGFVKNVLGRLQVLRKPVLQAIGCLAYASVDTIHWVDYGSWLLKPEGAKCVSLEAFLEKWLVLSALMIFTWQIAERFVSRHGSWAWKLFKVHYAPDLPFKTEPPDPPLGPTTGIICFKVKKFTKPTKRTHKSGEGVKKPLKPVHGRRWKDKRRLCRIAGVALSPFLLFNRAVAQVPTFDFHSEVDIQTASDCYHGFLSIKEVSSDDLDMI